MYRLTDACAVCLCNEQDLNHSTLADEHNLSYFTKLSCSISEMDFQQMNIDPLICKQCCQSIDIVYSFRKKCLETKDVFLNYFKRIETKNSQSFEISLHNLLENCIKVEKNIEENYLNFEERKTDKNEEILPNTSEIIIKKEIFIEDFEENNQHNFFQNQNFEDKTEENVKNEVFCEDLNHIEENQTEFSPTLTKIKTEIDIEENHEFKTENEFFSSNDSSIIGFSQNSSENNENESGEPKHQGPKMRKPRKQKELTAPWKNSLKDPIICSICQKKFYKKWSYEEHLRSHSGEKPFECEICQKKFSSSGNLRNHRKVHEAEKFVCGVCGKDFRFRAGFDRHMNTHSKCDVCGKSFKQLAMLKRHLRIHSGDKPFVCTQCGRGFSEKGTLTRHQVVHTGVKPHKCSLCPRAFALRRLLIEHERTHSGAAPYGCPLCPRRFRQTSGLSRHRRRHAEGKLPCWDPNAAPYIVKIDD